jgi:glutamate dehydrogenase (NAD(P)+)
MGKRFEEASNTRILHAVESLTGRTFESAILSTAAAGAGEADLVDSGLEDTMVTAYREIRAIRLEHDTDLRSATYVNSINKVAQAYIDRGIFP